MELDFEGGGRGRSGGRMKRVENGEEIYRGGERVRGRMRVIWEERERRKEE